MEYAPTADIDREGLPARRHRRRSSHALAARARAARHVRAAGPARSAVVRCAPALSASRFRPRRATADYVPVGHRGARHSGPSLPLDDGARRARARCSRIAAIAKIGHDLKFDAIVLGAPRRRARRPRPRHDARELPARRDAIEHPLEDLALEHTGLQSAHRRRRLRQGRRRRCRSPTCRSEAALDLRGRARRSRAAARADASRDCSSKRAAGRTSTTTLELPLVPVLVGHRARRRPHRRRRRWPRSRSGSSRSSTRRRRRSSSWPAASSTSTRRSSWPKSCSTSCSCRS